MKKTLIIIFVLFASVSSFSQTIFEHNIKIPLINEDYEYLFLKTQKILNQLDDCEMQYIDYKNKIVHAKKIVKPKIEDFDRIHFEYHIFLKASNDTIEIVNYGIKCIETNKFRDLPVSGIAVEKSVLKKRRISNAQYNKLMGALWSMVMKDLNVIKEKCKEPILQLKDLKTN